MGWPDRGAPDGATAIGPGGLLPPLVTGAGAEVP